MKKSDYVGFGTEEDSFVFSICKEYNNNEDLKNAYLHVGTTWLEEGVPIPVSAKQLKKLSEHLLKLANKLENRLK